MHTHTHKMIEPQLSWGLGQERSSNQNGEKFLWWISKVLVWKVWILLSVVLSIKMHFDIFWRPVNILWISIEIPFLKQALYKNISSLNSKREWRRDQHFFVDCEKFSIVNRPEKIDWKIMQCMHTSMIRIRICRNVVDRDFVLISFHGSNDFQVETSFHWILQ